MLMLACDALLASVPREPMAHWGGALHGFVEGAALHHAPHLLPLLRPDGMDGYSAMAIEVPPFATPNADELSFGIVLFAHAAQAWAPLLRALMLQTASGLQGRAWQMRTVTLLQPGSAVLGVVTHGRLSDPLPEPEDTGAWVRRAKQPALQSGVCLHTLHLRSPLLLGGRDRIRREQTPAWPSLGSVLNSIARRAWALEPALALAIGTPQGWQAPEFLSKLQPLTLPADPARAIHWSYDARRSIVKPGLVGPLIYPAQLDAACQLLLYWGQWLGVGQQTTLGCGRYVWQPQALPLEAKTACNPY